MSIFTNNSSDSVDTANEYRQEGRANLTIYQNTVKPKHVAKPLNAIINTTNVVWKGKPTHSGFQNTPKMNNTPPIPNEKTSFADNSETAYLPTISNKPQQPFKRIKGKKNNLLA